MPRQEHNNTVYNSRGSLSPLEPSNLMILTPENCNIGLTHSQENNFIAFMNVNKALKEEINNP